MIDTTATAGTLRAHRPARRPSVLSRTASALTCHITDSIEALDLSTTSPAQTLASLRFLVLSYLSDVETRLSQLDRASITDSKLAEALKSKRELTIDEARAWASVALEMLSTIRAEVLSHLPDVHIADVSVESVEDFVRAHLPDLPDVAVPRLDGVRSHLPDMPDVRSRLPDFSLSDVRSKFEGVRSRICDIDFKRPLTYIPILSDRLRSLHSHLSSKELPSGFELGPLAPNTVLSDLLDAVHCSDLWTDLGNASSDVREAEELLDRASTEIKLAVKRSLQGSRLIDYVDLPDLWRNNPYVTRGYR